MPKYRPNVAAILLRADHKILVAERINVENSWQFPQGGVDDGEDLIAAIRREVEEELGLASKYYEIAECRTGYRYKFPKAIARREAGAAKTKLTSCASFGAWIATSTSPITSKSSGNLNGSRLKSLSSRGCLHSSAKYIAKCCATFSVFGLRCRTTRETTLDSTSALARDSNHVSCVLDQSPNLGNGHRRRL